MSKKRVETKRPLTKRQISKWQRERRIQRIAISVGVFFFVSIVGWIAYGYYTEQVKPLRQPAVRVNDAVFDMGYYVKVLDILSQGQEPAAITSAADTAIRFIAQAELIRQKAADLGVGITTDEVSNELNSLGLPDAKIYRDIVAARILTSKLIKDYFEPKVPAACEQAKVYAMFLESKKVAEEARERLQAGDDFAFLAEKGSREAMTKERKGDLGWLPKGFTDKLFGELGNSKLEEIVFSLDPGMVSEPVYDDSVTKKIGYWVLKVVEKDTAKGSHVLGMLLSTWDEAADIKVRLEAGEDFSDLAKKYSQHLGSKEQGGDLGWTRGGEFRNRLIAAFAEPLEPGGISKPVTDESVQTKGGYWLVKVEQRDPNRQLDEKLREALVFKLFQDWVNELLQNSMLENYLTEEDKAWAVSQVLRSRR